MNTIATLNYMYACNNDEVKWHIKIQITFQIVFRYTRHLKNESCKILETNPPLKPVSPMITDPFARLLILTLREHGNTTSKLNLSGMLWPVWTTFRQSFCFESAPGSIRSRLVGGLSFNHQFGWRVVLHERNSRPIVILDMLSRFGLGGIGDESKQDSDEDLQSPHTWVEHNEIRREKRTKKNEIMFLFDPLSTWRCINICTRHDSDSDLG